MRLAVTHPNMLWLLVLVPPLLWLAWRAPRPAQRGRKLAAMALRGLLMSALVLALAGLHVRLPVDDTAVVFLIDLSDSVPPAQQEAAVTFVRRALQARGEHDVAGIVVFGKNALVERTVGALQDVPGIESIPVRTRTDIAEALQVGLTLFPAEYQKRFVLLSDGQANEGDWRALLPIVQAYAIPIDVVALQGGIQGPEVALKRLDVPATAREGERLDVRVVLASNTNGAVRVHLLRENQVWATREVTLTPGETTLTFEVPASQTGFLRLQAVLEPQNSDTFPQNNRAEAFTIVEGPPRVLVVARSTEEAAPLVAALQAANMLVDQIPPSALPTSATTLAGYQSVVLVNVPAPDVSTAAQEALATFVRDTGGGLVMIGGPQSFGAGLWSDTPVEAALPVEMRVRAREQEPNIALVLAVDKSGSMGQCHCEDPNDTNAMRQRALAGIPKVDIAKAAVLQAAAALGDFDYIGVVAFDSEARWVLEPQRFPGRAALEEQIGTLIAEGSTNIFAGLKAAETELAGVPAKVRHIILVTDGWSRAGDYQALAAALREEGITLSVVAAGNGSAVEELSQLAAQGGGRFYPAPNVGDIPQIFLKETIRVYGRYIVEEPFRPVVASPSPVLRGLRLQWPVLLGYNGTTRKPAAVAPLLTPQGDPLLAHWRYGLGRAAAWTSDFTGRWAQALIQDEEGAALMRQIVAWTFPPPQSTALQASILPEGSGVRISVVAERELAAQPGETRLRLVAPDGAVRDMVIPPVAPDTFETFLELDQPGAYLATIIRTDEDGTPLEQSQAGFVIPYSPEYQLTVQDETTLRTLALETGGRLPVEAEQVWAAPGQRAVRVRDLWPFLLVLSALLLVPDIAVRRLDVRREGLTAWRAWWQERIQQWRVEPALAAERSTERQHLFEAKTRARRPYAPPPSPPTSPPSAPSSHTTKTAPPAPSAEEDMDAIARLKQAKKRRRGAR
ncbi:VWA domain-containing protein [Ardenticatena maritima]|uniref:VWA domain-containing protein n=2 Tax=Ardenticatena maritima TaxID=872965 RepID=UPI0007613D7A|nr:VWA domain-containing protein [Ardenticatena maritima]